jgi:hypothetical protein
MIIIMALKLCFPSFWIRHYADLQWPKVRNTLMEYYIVGKTVVMFGILGLWLATHPIWWILTAYLLGDLITYLLWLVVLAELNHSQPNFRRNLILLGVNMIEINAAFAIFYIASGSLRHWSQVVDSWLDAFYFSLSTFATVWFGDMIAVGQLWHIVSMAQILVSFLFISLVLTSVASKIEIRSEW